MGQLHCIYNCMERGFQYLTLCLWVWKFLLRCRNYRIWLQVCSIPRCLNIFSRKVQRSSLEWTLLPSVFQQLSDYLQVYIDLCASCWNAKLQTFVSPVSDLQCWSVFGLSIPWDGMIAYTFLPVILLPQALGVDGQDACSHLSEMGGVNAGSDKLVLRCTKFLLYILFLQDLPDI